MKCTDIDVMTFKLCCLLGASLANERGMLECKVDTLSQENKSLRANLDTEVDTVKIKTKLVSDLTDTVSTLKQRVGHLESEVKEKDRQLQTITVCFIYFALILHSGAHKLVR